MKRKSEAERRRRESGNSVRRRATASRARGSFLIVGIGASAGGLEALEEFLGHVPAGSGMAFVIVQHLDPTHKGIMPGLLQRATGMKVLHVVRKEIQEVVIFAPRNLIMNPPFTKLDILSCRNLLIYLSPEVQKKLMPLFHYSLNPGGILFLGSAETIGGHTSLFAPVSAEAKVYRRTESALSPGPVEFPAAFSAGAPLRLEPPPAPKPAASLQSLADQLVLQHYAPPSVLVSN
jgi:hypothetical protein